MNLIVILSVGDTIKDDQWQRNKEYFCSFDSIVVAHSHSSFVMYGWMDGNCFVG
jgi:hypothetical protein